MTDRLDTLLREVIHDLAAEGDLVRSEDRDRRRFALDATDRGYQHRNRRRASLVGVVALVVALAVGVPYGLGLTRTDGARGIEPGASPSSDVTIGPDGVPTHVITDKTRPIELGGRLVRAWEQVGAGLDEQDVHNESAGKASRPRRTVSGSWYGARLTSTSSESPICRPGQPARTRSDAVIGEPQWSPDGTRLLFTKPPNGEQPFNTLLAVVLERRRLAVHNNAARCSRAHVWRGRLPAELAAVRHRVRDHACAQGRR